MRRGRSIQSLRFRPRKEGLMDSLGEITKSSRVQEESLGTVGGSPTVVSACGEATVFNPSTSNSSSKQRRHRVPVWSLILAAALVAALVPAAAILHPWSGGRSPFTTRWQPAHALGSSTILPEAGSHPDTIQLVSTLTGAFTMNSDNGPELGGNLSCPAASACYMAGRGASVAFSSDVGQTWQGLPLPTGFTLTTPLSCPAESVCVGGGLLGGQATVAETTDSGHQWTVVPLSGNLELTSLTCNSADTCDGVTGGITPAAGPSSYFSVYNRDQAFVEPAHGWKHCSSQPLPTGYAVASLKCPTSSECTLIGSNP